MLEIARDKKNIEKKEREMKNKEKVKQQQKTIFYFYFFILKNVAFCWKIYSEKVVNSFNLYHYLYTIDFLRCRVFEMQQQNTNSNIDLHWSYFGNVL